MKKLIIILILIGNVSLAVNPLEKVLPNDKQLHVMTAYILTDVMREQLKWNWLQTLAGIYVISRVKEQIDVSCGGRWDNADIEANNIGWAGCTLVNIKW